MMPQEYFEQIFELEEKASASRRKESLNNYRHSCSINGKKIARALELTQEINNLTDELTELKLKHSNSKGYKGAVRLIVRYICTN